VSAGALPLLPTTLVGSYPQPDWLVDRKVLLGHGPPRVRLKQVWRIPEDELEAAQDDAVRLALRDQERAGIDVVTDGEVRRESYFNKFATALSGIDLDRPGEVISRTGRKTQVPRVVGPIRRERPVLVRDAEFLRAETDRPIRMTVPGGFTLAKLAQDEHYGDFGRLVDAYADAVNAEVRDLEAAGVDFVQIDEPYLQANPDDAAKHGVRAIDRALDGIAGPSAVHLCFGYAYVVSGKPAGYSYLPELEGCRAEQVSIEAAQPKLDPAILRRLPSKQIIYGVIDLGTKSVESPETVAGRIRGALGHVPPERLILAPDCGMKYLPRDIAFAKLEALVAGAKIVRAEIAGRA
jgi:5-methyltetrahydropteroyltriglutamate--homocysteine methyltransferase